MPLYIPWLTETIKKRGVRYLLHHYLGQFFEEKLTLEQLSIDIYEGRGSIRNLALDVDGLNDELDFIPFKFLEGCLIGQISVEVPWSSLATDACRVELDGAKFYCRLKTSADASKAHCTESTLLSRSLMTSSMQMAEEIVTTEDDEDTNDLTSSIHHHHHHHAKEQSKQGTKDANQMFEGLEMFAQLIDSVLRRTKLTARDTLFQIKPHHDDDIVDETDSNTTSRPKKRCTSSAKSSGDEFSEPLANSDTESEEDSERSSSNSGESEDEEEDDVRKDNKSEKTVEFFIRFFRCEEMIDETTRDMGTANEIHDDDEPGQASSKSLCALPETITKLLTLEDVEMRIDGRPVSNLVGKHTITIKFNGQKSEISIFSGSPLLAVISHKQLETFFNVFDGSGVGTGAAGQDMSSSFAASAGATAAGEQDQKLMGPEDYAKIENQLLEQSASLRNAGASSQFAGGSIGGAASVLGGGGARHGARRWVESGELYSDMGSAAAAANADSSYKYQSGSDKLKQSTTSSTQASEPTLDHIEAFSCELKLPGIWLCLLRDGEALPSPLIKPHADSINSFQSINKYIDSMIKFPHLRLLALKVALDITAKGTQIFLGDLDISEHLQETSEAARMSPVMRLLNNDQANIPMSSARYKATIVNGRDITVDLLARTRLMFDPTIIDRLVYDYQLIKMEQLANDPPTTAPKSQGGTLTRGTRHRTRSSTSSTTHNNIQRNSTTSPSDHLNLTIRGEQAKIELLCPIPDLRPDAHTRRTQLRPQSFLFNFKDFNITWQQADKLKISSSELTGHVKSSPQQADSEAVKFLEASSTASDKCLLLVEPSPSNLLDNDDLFTRDIEQALNESSMYESIYVSQATESKIPTEPFQTKRKVVRASFQATDGDTGARGTSTSTTANECDHEKILTPGERQHLLDYLQQTMASTKLSLNLHLPICEVEFEDKEQLDLIYNRFGNDFVFWQPRALSKQQPDDSSHGDDHLSRRKRRKQKSGGGDPLEFRRPMSTQQANSEDATDDDEDVSSDADNEGSEVSFHSISHAGDASPGGECTHRNEVTCKVVVDELFVKFNHQSCAAALKQEITADNFLMGVVIDVNGKPSTLLSLVADKLELSTDLETVLEGNTFASKDSIFALTAEIKRPTKALKDIKLAVQLKNGLLNDFRTETYTRFWQSINVTDEPILGYVAPQIVTELHIDILETGLLLVRDGARPALLSMDEIYLTSMVVAETSQVMIRLIADEVSLYMKRDKSGLEVMKNYICLIDSGLIDLDVKFGGDQERLEFGVINNVITVRVCQDSLSALCRLFNVLVRDSTTSVQQVNNSVNDKQVSAHSTATGINGGAQKHAHQNERAQQEQQQQQSGDVHRGREMDLLVDAMNDYTLAAAAASSSSCGSTERVNAASNQLIIRNAGASERRRGSLSSVASSSGGGGGKDARRDKSEQDDDDNDDDDPGDHSDAEDESRASSSARSTSEEEDDDNDDYDSDDAPPGFQRAASSSAGSSSSNSNGSSSMSKRRSERVKQRRDPNACLLDESNPMLGDLISPPLLPATPPVSGTRNELNLDLDDQTQPTPPPRPMDESGFFVIGDDDVGAGIIDKSRGQHEPLVRKLIEGPISIVENHFKMTRPRTLPEMLANSLERYVLEEMTLVVNLFGGRDFHDDDGTSEDEAAAATNEESNTTTSGQLEIKSNKSSRASSERACEATNELLDVISKNNTNGENQSLRARAGSVASPRRQMSFGGGCGSLKRAGGRRKHFSESGELAGGGGAQHVEQRVRFGEGAVNLWESLDLMSSPDFLGVRGRPGPTKPALSSDSKQAGGTWRQTDVCIQLTLSKVKLLYELADRSGAELATSAAAVAPGASTQSAQAATRAAMAWRFMLFIQDIEVRDRVAASDINKVLYEYCNESMPKRSTQMLTIKNTATINPTDGCEECDLRVSLKPLRLNIDQDTLLFLIEFFTTLAKSLARQQSIYAARNVAASGSSSSGIATTSSTARSSGKSMASSEANRVASAAVNLSKRTSSDGDNSSSAPPRAAAAAAVRVTRNDARATRNNLESAQVLADDALCNHARRDSLSSFASSSTSDCDSEARAGSLSAQTAAGARTSTPGNNSLGASDLKGRKQASKDESISKPSRAGGLPTHCHTGGNGGGGAAMDGPECREQPIYIKSFTFSPDVPIRIDYHAKHLDFEQGALAGILMGLAHLDHSELILRRVQAKHGMRGLDRVLVFAINSWLADIKRNQLPSILSGVGPMYSVIQLFQGMRDLIWMPIDHYRKDGRLVRGLQRGASSFSSSTAMAAINLVNRFISIVQCTAQIAHDIVTPPGMGASGRHGGGQVGVSGSGEHNQRRGRARRTRAPLKSSGSGLAGQSGASASASSTSLLASNSRLNHHQSNGLASHSAGGLNQPRNFCEGVAVGFSILKEGFNDTARNVTVGMQAEDMRSAVGELVRQIPSTLLNPIISATEGAQSVLVGIRNQIAPDARRDDQEKWKGRVRGK